MTGLWGSTSFGARSTGLQPDEQLRALTRAASYWLSLGENGRACAVLDAYCERFPMHEDAARVCFDRGRVRFPQNDPGWNLRVSAQWFHSWRSAPLATKRSHGYGARCPRPS